MLYISVKFLGESEQPWFRIVDTRIENKSGINYAEFQAQALLRFSCFTYDHFRRYIWPFFHLSNEESEVDESLKSRSNWFTEQGSDKLGLHGEPCPPKKSKNKQIKNKPLSSSLAFKFLKNYANHISFNESR